MHILAATSEDCLVLSKNKSLNPHMNRFNMLILLLQLMLFNIARAQSPSTDMDVASQDVVSNFRPSLAVVIGILAIMFSLTFVLLLYAKFCHRASPVHNATRIVDGLPRSRSVLSGLDKTVIESLPFFRFSSLRGSREGLECAVCLSKFEEIEILRLLPTCKHAFHIDCIDQWLEKHSSCPLCRHRVSADDLSVLRDSSSLRYLRNESHPRDDSNPELYVEREENHRHGSSRFSITSSFRKSERGKNEEELPLQHSTDSDENNKALHQFNHKIVISDFVLKNRWSNVSSSDLLFLNSEMLIDISSNRFSSLDANTEQPAGSKVAKDGEIMNIKEEMERKRLFESKFGKIKQNDSFPFPSLPNAAESQDYSCSSSNFIGPADKRSMSEITAHPRSIELNRSNSIADSSLRENNVREERRRRLWLPIARRTVQWFANRERIKAAQTHNTRQSLNV